jgi:hypothetical protein
VRIRPLTLASIGVLLVAVDLRMAWADLLPDAIGWALLAFGAHQLEMRWPTWLAGAAAVASLSELQLPYEWQAFDLLSGRIVEHPGPGTDYDERLVFLGVDGPRLVLMALAVVLGTAALTLMLRELRRRSTTTDDRSSTQQLGILSWAVPLGWTLPYVLVVIGFTADEGSFDPVWNDARWELVALVAIGIALAIAILFWTRANRRWSASGDEIGSPWGDLLVREIDSQTG